MCARLKAINPARNRRRILVAGAVMTMLSILPVVSTRQLQSAHATAPSDVTGTTTCSTPYNFVSASAITSAGTYVALPAESLQDTIADALADTMRGRAYSFASQGTIAQSLVPPTGWTPAVASADELDRYGYPPRPTGGDALTEWTDEYGQMSTVPVTSMCATNASNALVKSVHSANWAGGMSVNSSSTLNTYDYANAHWTQPTFVGVCPAASLYSIWSGIGGYTVPQLIQSGTDATTSTLNGATFWWEMLNSNFDTKEVDIFNLSVSPGDAVGALTSYANGEAHFDLYNFTHNQHSTVDVAYAGGYPASQYYRGNTAEYISEAPSGGSGPGGYYYLRKPSSGTLAFPYATANGQAIGAYPTYQIDELGVSGRAMQDSSFDGSHAWNDVWRACS